DRQIAWYREPCLAQARDGANRHFVVGAEECGEPASTLEQSLRTESAALGREVAPDTGDGRCVDAVIGERLAKPTHSQCVVARGLRAFDDGQAPVSCVVERPGGGRARGGVVGIEA